MKYLNLTALLASVLVATSANAAVIKDPVVKTTTTTTTVVKTTEKTDKKVANKVTKDKVVKKATTKKTPTNAVAVKTKTTNKTTHTSNSQGEVNIDIPADTKINETRSINGQAVAVTTPTVENVAPVTEVNTVDNAPAQ